MKTKKNMSILDWLEIVKSRQEKKSTAQSYNTLKTHLLTFMKDRRMEEMTLGKADQRFCLGFKEYLSKAGNTRVKESFRPIGTITQRKLFVQFSTLLSKAVQEGILKTNPCANIKKPSFTAAERNFLTEEELDRLILTPCRRNDVREAFLFSCFTGLRWSDIKSLEFKDIHKSEGIWTIKKTMVKTGTWLSLPLCDGAIALLPRRDIGPVFHLPVPSCANAVIRDWAKDASIDKKITFHCARHTFATLLLKKGADIYTVSKLLGHTNIATTQIYARILDESKFRAIKLLDIVDDKLSQHYFH